jgi:ABC-type lipoprotein export system ATPase subunit
MGQFPVGGFANVVMTDHNTVICISKMQNKNHRLTKCGFMLQEYNLIINHIKCKDNCIVNVLSKVG